MLRYAGHTVGNNVLYPHMSDNLMVYLSNAISAFNNNPTLFFLDENDLMYVQLL